MKVDERDAITSLTARREMEGIHWAEAFLRTHFDAINLSEIEINNASIWFASAIQAGRRRGQDEMPDPLASSGTTADRWPAGMNTRIAAVEKAFELLRDDTRVDFSTDNVLAIARYIEGE